MSQWIALVVLAAGERVRVADREVDRAVDLLVERDVLHEALDAGVAADPELAEPPRARRRCRACAAGTPRPLGADASTIRALLEDEPHAVDLVPVVDGRELARTRSRPRPSPRSASRRPRRPACSRARRRPRRCGRRADSVRSVPAPDDPHLVRVVEDVGDAPHPLGLGVPVAQDRLEDELLVAAPIVMPASCAPSSIGYSAITHGTSIAIVRVAHRRGRLLHAPPGAPPRARRPRACSRAPRSSMNASPSVPDRAAAAATPRAAARAAPRARTGPPIELEGELQHRVRARAGRPAP